MTSEKHERSPSKTTNSPRTRNYEVGVVKRERKLNKTCAVEGVNDTDVQYTKEKKRKTKGVLQGLVNVCKS